MIDPAAPLPTSSPGDPRYPSTAQHEVLIALARRNNWRTGAEIGLLKGKTFGFMLAAGLRIIGVDRWQQVELSDVDGAETYRRFDMAAAEAQCRAIAARYGATILKGDSVEMAGQVPDGSLDFVFIDALHTTESVRADIAAWAPKVRTGGWITGHDWWFPSVRAALDEVTPGWTRHEHSVWSLPRAEYQA